MHPESFGFAIFLGYLAFIRLVIACHGIAVPRHKATLKALSTGLNRRDALRGNAGDAREASEIGRRGEIQLGIVNMVEQVR